MCWEEVEERGFHGPKLIRESEKVKLIHKCLKVARRRQKSCVDVRRRDLQFQEGDKVFLKVSPARGMLRFGQKGKLSKRFIQPYEILSCVGDAAYRLALPSELSGIHNVFHVSMLKRCVSDPSHVLRHKPLKIQEDDTYIETLVRVIDTKEKELRNRTIHWVKVIWENDGPEEATWELSDQVQKKYHHILPEVSCDLEDQTLQGWRMSTPTQV